MCYYDGCWAMMLNIFLEDIHSISCFIKISNTCMRHHHRCRGNNFSLIKPVMCYLLSKVPLHASVCSGLCCSCDPSQPGIFS